MKRAERERSRRNRSSSTLELVEQLRALSIRMESTLCDFTKMKKVIRHLLLGGAYSTSNFEIDTYSERLGKVKTLESLKSLVELIANEIQNNDREPVIPVEIRW